MKNLSLLFLIIILSTFLIFYGEIGFGYNHSLVLDVRLPKVVACIGVGGVLALAGLLMQIFFQNPLAGPDILGVSSGSVLFVALWTMGSSFIPVALYSIGAKLASLLGALSVFIALMMIVRRQNSKVTILIVGILLTSFLSAIVSVLVNNASAESVKNYLIWGQGTFRNIYLEDLPLFVFLIVLSFIPLVFLRKKISIYMLGENYAKSLGVDSNSLQKHFVLLTSIYVAIATYYCGPIIFLGIISPYLAKRLIKRSNLKELLPASFLIGSTLSLFAELILTTFSNWHLTINSIFGFIGAPILIYYSLKQREIL